MKREAVMGEQGPAKPPYPREPHHPGGEQELGGPVPPYEGRSEGPSAPHTAGEGSQAGPREISDAEREGVPDTDTTAASPLGVGVSTTKRGEERMYGTSKEAQKAEQTEAGTQREPNIDEESPPQMMGDQGG
jgi:hypothetical protein